jgi:type IV pilus assembly protein PilQ
VNPQVTLCNNVSYQIYDLVIRQLKTGEFRVRDGQTLILTGVIQDSVRELANKWPVVGDLPLIGQFFRSSSNQREKRELVMVVTPRIVDDEQGGTYGYGYEPSSSEARKLIYRP